MADLTPTADPFVGIEHEEYGYVRYRGTDGRRWEVTGMCDYRGWCLIGAVNPLLGPREGRLDVPVGPGFSGCCDLIVRVLEDASP
jgi:hypothetical protein